MVSSLISPSLVVAALGGVMPDGSAYCLLATVGSPLDGVRALFIAQHPPVVMLCVVLVEPALVFFAAFNAHALIELAAFVAALWAGHLAHFSSPCRWLTMRSSGLRGAAIVFPAGLPRRSR